MFNVVMVDYSKTGNLHLLTMKTYKRKGYAVREAKRMAQYAPSNVAFRVTCDGKYVEQYSRVSFTIPG